MANPLIRWPHAIARNSDCSESIIDHSFNSMGARRWFQIHLSTAIVMMLFAVALLWANVHGRVDWVLFNVCYGWPLEALLRREIHESPALQDTWYLNSVAIDAGVLLGTLAVVAVGCERALRRREARKR